MGRHGRTPGDPGRVPPRRPEGGQRLRGQHRKQSPARAGMLGASAAVAVGALAVGTGLVGGGLGQDGGENHTAADKLRAGNSPGVQTQGTSETPTGSAPAGSRTPSHSTAPEKTDPTTTAPEKTAEPSSKAPSKASRTPAEKASEAPSSSSSAPRPAKTTSKPPATRTPSATTAAENEVLRLVNQQRSKAGCQPLKADAQLAKLAGAYSEDMAKRDFFDHTDPDGDDPWDRAKALGITDLGGENIARGQANAQSVMDAWMNSPGHKANILNCDFKTLGVGAYFADGGPWWTQDFGY